MQLTLTSVQLKTNKTAHKKTNETKIKRNKNVVY